MFTVRSTSSSIVTTSYGEVDGKDKQSEGGDEIPQIATRGSGMQGSRTLGLSVGDKTIGTPLN